MSNVQKTALQHSRHARIARWLVLLTCDSVKVLLTDTLRRMLHDQAWYDQLRQGQLKAAQPIALFDGQANRRISI